MCFGFFFSMPVLIILKHWLPLPYFVWNPWADPQSTGFAFSFGGYKLVQIVLIH